jgi:uncharacterized ferritin-like protein (DUF455 family)
VTAPSSLVGFARRIVADPDPDAKVAYAIDAARAWRSRSLSLGARSDLRPMPDRPGRPERPLLLAPRNMPKRSIAGLRGRIALVHSLAHIELNAVDLTWDLVGRFAHVSMPGSFIDDWVQVGLEEATHFRMVSDRLRELGSTYGDLPAHDGLWQAAQDTGHSLIARIAIIPLVLEARGLDVTPGMIERMRDVGDEATAHVLEVIYCDERKHVAFGAKWFRYLCGQESKSPELEFHRLVRLYFKGGLKPPFNDKARSEAGLTPGFYKPLCSLTG